MSPILIKDFNWSENGGWIFITFEVKGIKAASADVISSPTYLKVHSSPFIFETFLRHEVDDTQGECTIDENSGKISFRLKKASEDDNHWEELENKSLSKAEKIAIRAEAIELTHARHKQEKEEKHKMRFDRKQKVVRDQIQLDAVVRDRITALKNQEGVKALSELNKWALSSSLDTETKTKEAGSADRKEQKLKKQEAVPKSKSIFTEFSTDNQATLDDLTITNAGGDNPPPERVAIRSSICIPVKFTPRTFSTPSRESTHVDEQEWLKKQAEARRHSGFVDEDLRPEERNPQWLLDKGLSLMRTESYLGAISAFSLGIRLAPKMPELYVERGGAHLAIKNYNRTVHDCTHALELLTPKVKGNEEDRRKCYDCRAKAFRALDLMEEAAADEKELVKLEPEKSCQLGVSPQELPHQDDVSK